MASSAEQYWAGLVGAWLWKMRRPARRRTRPHIWSSRTYHLSGSSPAPHSTMMDYMHGKEGNIIMVNGQVNPRLYMKAGQVQRWRILNASNARFYQLSLDGHTMNLIGTDGGLLDKPYPQIRTAALAGRAGRRAGKGDEKLRQLQAAGTALLADGHDVRRRTITLLTMTYKGSMAPAKPPCHDQSGRRAASNPAPLRSCAERTLTLEHGHGTRLHQRAGLRCQPLYGHVARRTRTSSGRSSTTAIWTTRSTSM